MQNKDSVSVSGPRPYEFKKKKKIAVKDGKQILFRTVTGTGTTAMGFCSGGDWAQPQIQHGNWEFRAKEQGRG